MTIRKICFFVLPLAAAPLFCLADSKGPEAFSTAQYRTELDGLLAVTSQLDSSGASTPDALHHLPQKWLVHTEQRDFEIPSEGLQRDVRRYDDQKTATNANAIRTRIQSLRAELDGFEKTPSDSSANRAALNSILARPEFHSVHGPTWRDRLKRWLLEHLFRFLGKVVRSSAIPTIGKYFVYGLMALALLALLYVAYRSIFRGQELDEVIPKDLPISAKEWTIWMQEARAAAAKGQWRDAVHLSYWAGISFLERQGYWKPDRARTPREYLRLLAGANEQRETLTTLTQIFELAWYAKREASEQTFSQTLEQLEKLGCR